MKRIWIIFSLTIALLLGGMVSPQDVLAAKDDGSRVFRPQPEMYFLVGSDRYKVKRLIRGIDKSGLVSIVEITVPGNATETGLMARLHGATEPESIYILEGNFAFERAELPAVVTMSNGELLQVPAGLVYSLRNNREVPGKLLVTSNLDWTTFLTKVGASSRTIKSLAATAPVIKPEPLEKVASQYGFSFPAEIKPFEKLVKP